MHEVEIVGEGPALAWSRTGGGDPGPMRAGDSTRVTLEVRNDGCAPWSPEHDDRLAYHWYDAEGRQVVSEGLRTGLPELAPDEQTEFEAVLEAPANPGSYRLQWRPLREGLKWFPDDDPLVAVEVGEPQRGWSVAWPEPPSRLGSGESLSVRLWLRNEGREEWSSERGDVLSYRWFDESGAQVAEGARTRLPTPWMPGDAALVDAVLTTPPASGRHHLVWELVREGVAWYGPPRHGVADAWVDVTDPGLAWALVEVEDPGYRWAQRSGTLRVVLLNTGLETWSPERGDRLSYRWIDEQGRPLLDDGLRTVLPSDVAPGDHVIVQARVRGPPRAGEYTLQLEMVREHVRWYGAPTEGHAQLQIRIERWSSYWVLVLGAIGLLAAEVLRRSSIVTLGRWIAWRVGPALWTGAAVAALVHCFVDLSGAEPWRGMELVVIGPAPLITLCLWPWSPRAQAWGGVLTLVLLSLLALADLAYLHFFGSIVPLSAVAAVHHLVDAESTVSSLLRPEYGWVLALPVLALVLALRWPPRPGAPAPKGLARSRWVGAAVLVLGCMPMVLALAEAFESGLDRRVFSERDNVRRLGVVGAHVFAVLRAIDGWLGPRELSPAEHEALVAVRDAAVERRLEASRAAPGFGVARGFDVIVIQVEALQDWVVGARVEGRAVMPTLEDAMGDALYFDQVFDQTGQGRTSDAEYLVLGSGHPLERGALAFVHADNDFYTLAHVLADAGYHTQSAHPYQRGFWNRAQVHPRYGFAESSFRRELGDGPHIGWGLTDSTFFERMQPRLAGAPAPSMAFLVTLSLHHPYEDFPDAYKELELGGLEGGSVGNYLHAMHHFDGALAELLQWLRDEGRMDRTVLVIYGDHVTGLGEPPPVLALAGRPAWDPSVHVALHRVPVFVWAGDGRSTGLIGRRSTVGGHIDIGATVLHLLGMDDPRPAAWGRTLLDPDPGFAALSDGSAVDAELAFVARGTGIPREGGCFEREGRSVPLERCAALVERARTQRTSTRQVLEHDLHRRLESNTPQR